MLRKFARPILFIATLAAFASYGTIMLRGPHGLRVLGERRAEARRLEEENADLQYELNKKQTRIDKLKNDRSAQETAVKKVLGYRRPDETLFKTSTAVAPTPK
jgi:cell division protein FtsB